MTLSSFRSNSQGFQDKRILQNAIFFLVKETLKVDFVLRPIIITLNIIAGKPSLSDKGEYFRGRILRTHCAKLVKNKSGKEGNFSKLEN